MDRPRKYITEFTLTAAEVGPYLEMPLSSLIVMVIDTATAHANEIGIGFDTLKPHNASWVLGRLSVELDDVPRVGGTYRLETWVEGVSRLFSDRGFALKDAATGRCIGRIHTVWMAIDLSTRRSVDLSILGSLDDVTVTDPEYPSRCARISGPSGEEAGYDYTFKVSDIDVNRHVTTRRYIDLIVDLLPLEAYAGERIRQFDIAFRHEARYGETARVSRSGADSAICVDGTPCVFARLVMEPREDCRACSDKK